MGFTRSLGWDSLAGQQGESFTQGPESRLGESGEG